MFEGLLFWVIWHLCKRYWWPFQRYYSYYLMPDRIGLFSGWVEDQQPQTFEEFHLSGGVILVQRREHIRRVRARECNHYGVFQHCGHNQWPTWMDFKLGIDGRERRWSSTNLWLWNKSVSESLIWDYCISVLCLLSELVVLIFNLGYLSGSTWGPSNHSLERWTNHSQELNRKRWFRLA